ESIAVAMLSAPTVFRTTNSQVLDGGLSCINLPPVAGARARQRPFRLPRPGSPRAARPRTESAQGEGRAEPGPPAERSRREPGGRDSRRPWRTPGRTPLPPGTTSAPAREGVSPNDRGEPRGGLRQLGTQLSPYGKVAC